MNTTIEPVATGSAEAVLRDCFATLQQVARYRLPPAIDRRLKWLGENKQNLTSDERDELSALVDLAEDRTLEKVRAQATLRRLGQLFPSLAVDHP